MADLNDFTNRLHSIREAMRQRLPDIAVLMTMTAKGLAERNIREAGFKAVYSSYEVPAFFLKGKAKTKAGEALVEKNIDDGVDMNWADLRRGEGLQAGFVDLSFTNKMWAGMFPRNPYWEGDKVFAPLGGNNEEVIDKMNWNKERYGDFIGKVLTKKEIELLFEVVRDEIDKIFEEFGIKRNG